MRECPVDAAAEMAKLGDVAGAARFLGDMLDGPESLAVEQRIAILRAVVGYLVTASRHREALDRARELKQHLGIRRVPTCWVDLLALVVRFTGRVTPGGMLAKALASALGARAVLRRAELESVRAVQLAFFWYDIRVCQRLSLLQLALSRTERDIRRSLAWLGYSYGYAGRSRLGLPLLRRSLALAHRANDESTLVEAYPLLAIAYQMSTEPRRALHYHRLFQRRYGQRSAFYNLLSHTNMLSALLTLGRFDELTTQIEKCFSLSFALDASRHHLQVYGTHAVVMAIEHDEVRAAKALDRARAAATANDNPLDWTIYERLAALTYAVSGAFADAERSANRGLDRCSDYGGARWYERELRALRALAGAPRRITEFWSNLLDARARYLAAKVREQREKTADWRLSALAEQLEEALRTHAEFDPSRPPTADDLRAKLQRTFGTDCVVVASDLAELKRRVLGDRGMAPSALATETDDELRLVCADGRFFIGLRCVPTAEFHESLSVGVLFARLDALSESLVKAAFRLVLAQFVFVHSIRISRDIQAKQQRAAAVGALAQMLAHDMRRPFRMLRTVIGVLERARDPEELRRQAALVIPEVKLATDTADGLIADVMEISGQSAEARPEAVAPEEILHAALVETLRSHPSADIDFDYRFEHTTWIHVEPAKVQRVFSNVLANAIQAMDHRGGISVSTSQVIQRGQSFVAFTIANEGPPISEADRASLFAPFFTKNKPAGTGLGLAIAHRIVTAHGGSIECVSEIERGAAFRFTLPAVAKGAGPASRLPRHSAEITRAVAPAPADETRDSGAPALPEVAIVDDSQAFLLGWRTALAGRAHAHFFTSPEAFWSAIANDRGLLNRLAAVVTDYAFGNSRQTGVSFARAVKHERAEMPIFMSSCGYVARREIQGAIDFEIDKEAPSWNALHGALSKRAEWKVS